MRRFQPVGRALQLLREFFRLQAAGGIALIAAAGAALLLANSPWQGAYEQFRHAPLLGHAVEWWINDALMALFFLLVALEIKRETVSGQLSQFAQMLLPVLCALGGVIVPALLFAGINHADANALRGWAVPTATDIAFALGVLALLGSRAPLGMKLLLSTIAVVDDLVAIVIIALFYSHGLQPAWLLLAACSVAAMVLCNWRGVTSLAVYLLLGAATWYCVLRSGVHSTLAGVATGLLVPLRGKDASRSPLETLEHALHPWVAFAILPLFAFANAGLSLRGVSLSSLGAAVPLGVLLGLLLGKPVGIVGVALIARGLKLVRLPDGMDAMSLLGMGLLCGIGFTMSLFIAGLAWGASEETKNAAVLGVLAASLSSALLGAAWLSISSPCAGRTSRAARSGRSADR